MSLKRVIAPIIVIAVILTGLFVIDQEIIIPKFAEKLVRKQEDKQSLDVWFMNDDQGSLICSPSFDIGTDTLNNPIIFLREPVNEKYSHCVGQIRADSATYVGDGKWELINGIYLAKPENPLEQFAREVPIEYYETDLTPQQIPVRRQVNYMDLLSSRQLTELAKQTSQVKDLAELYSQKHNKITTPIINMIMLLISLPLLVCREPKAMKSAVTLSFVLTTLCFLLNFGCKMAAGEGMLLRPELWSWLPVFIFAPIVFIELETMKT